MSFTGGKLVRVSLVATKGGRSQVNTFHYDLSDGFLAEADNSVQDLADRFRDDVQYKWSGFFPSSWSIQPIQVIDELDPLNPTAPRQEWTSGSAIPGVADNSAGALPAGLCRLVSLFSDNIGKRHRGRLFLGGVLNEGEQDNGTWQSNVLTATATLMAAIPRQPDLAEGSSTATAKWCIYSRTARALNQTPYTSRVSAYIVRPQVHYLRRREGNQ